MLVSIHRLYSKECPYTLNIINITLSHPGFEPSTDSIAGNVFLTEAVGVQNTVNYKNWFQDQLLESVTYNPAKNEKIGINIPRTNRPMGYDIP